MGGCHPDLGQCSTPSPTTSSLPVETGCPANMTQTFAPGTTPAAIGNTILASIPNPAVFNFSDVIYSYGFLSPGIGSLAYAETNASTPATDILAFYESPDLPSTIGCATFGYVYSVTSGLCLTANATAGAYPEHQGASVSLQPCEIYNCTEPPVEQLFCSDEYTIGVYDPYQCMLFFGDTTFPNSFYGPT